MSSHSRAPSTDDVRSHIIASLFSRRAEDGTAEETLISFVKVYESDDGGQKTRYLIVAVTRLGKVVIHKAKRNSNLSFSKGKTWNLEDMRVLEVIGPSDFALTMTLRRYHWSTERPKDQTQFLNAIVKVYRSYTNGGSPELINFSLAPTPPAPSTYPTSEPTGFPVPRVNNLSPDLAPPPAPGRSGRAGSFSSLNSAATQNSLYPSASEGSRGRPSFDEEQRTPTTAGFSRSPLGDSNMRRPSFGEGGRAPSPRGPPHPGVAPPAGQSQPGQAGIGMGPPPPQRKMSDDRAKTPSGLRNVSAASEYEQPSAGAGAGVKMRRTESEMQAIAEGEGERSVSSRQRERERRPAPSPAPPAPPAIEVEEAPTPTAMPTPRVVPSQPQAQSQLPPTIVTTGLSPSAASQSPAEATASPSSANPHHRPARRASFHPPPLDTTIDRELLLQSRTGLLPGAAGMTLDGAEGDDAILGNVEEMLEGFDWGLNTGGLGGDGKRKGAEAIEGRLMDELTALDSANIHAFLESDDRTAQVLGHIDEALMELEDIDLQITGYRMQLNAVSDDISYIEGQGKGLQVQTSNQQALLNELRQLLQIVEVPPEDLRVLAQESPSSERGVKALELAAASLYKALQAGRDTANAEVAATIARMQEYQEQSSQFCKRISDFLDVTFKYQSDSTLAEYKKTSKSTMALAPHQTLGENLMMYTGLVLYVKEMDEDRYQKLCSNYMSTISQLHQSEMKDMLMNFMGSLNATSGDAGNDAAFSTAAGPGQAKPSALLKSRNAIGLGLGGAQPKKEKRGDDNITRAAELYQKAMMEIINQIAVEEGLIDAFLHLTDTESTFADHMELDSYFRRQAARHASKGMSRGMMQLVRSMMDLIFGFVELELKNWVEAAVERGPVAVVGIIGVTERVAKEAEEESTSMFFGQLFDKQLLKQRAMLDMFVNEQIRTIEASKMTIRKRKGVAFFVRHFPVFVERVESQMEGYDDLPIRGRVNSIYEKVVNSVFGSLQQLAKMDRADGQANEDKGQLNYHVIMIENMHQFIEDVEKMNTPVLGLFLQRAKGLYDDNLTPYIKMILRRSFARFMDFFDGVERLLQTTPANEVSLHQSYNRSALKKVLKDHGAKDMRKAVEAMSKRVDKHFADDEDPGSNSAAGANAQLIQTVWQAVTQELVRETTRAQGIVAKSYADSGLGLEYSGADVDAVCKKAK
ncbi:hypothetical protein IAT38_002486 [Cryptococcus sp. DSM 104549]